MRLSLAGRKPRISPEIVVGFIADDMLIKLWDWEKKWACTQVFEGHTHYVMQIVINPKDNNTFASASLDRSVKVSVLLHQGHSGSLCQGQCIATSRSHWIALSRSVYCYIKVTLDRCVKVSCVLLHQHDQGHIGLIHQGQCIATSRSHWIALSRSVYCYIKVTGSLCQG